MSLAGARFIKVDADFLYYFDRDAEVRRANEAINQTIVGSNPFYVVINGGAPGVLKRWEVLKLIKDLQSFLLTLPGITSSVSIVDYLEVLETGLGKQAEGGDLVVTEQGELVPASARKSFWEDPRGLEPVLAMVSTSPSTFKSVVTSDFSKASILVRTKLSGSRRIEETLDRIRTYIAEHFPAEIPVRLTGTLVLLTGLLTDKQASKRGVGGEVLAYVW